MPSSRVSAAIRGKIGAVTYRATIGGNGVRLDGSQLGGQPTEISEKIDICLEYWKFILKLWHNFVLPVQLSILEEAEHNCERLEISSMQQAGF